jgi:hypothetical protein
MKPKKRYETPKLFEFRIKYNAGADHSAIDSYHYYSAESPEDALVFHTSMMKRRNFKSQTLSIEKKNPYANRWEDQSYILNANEI